MEKETAIIVFESLASSVRLDVFRLLVRHAPDGLVEAFEVEGARTFACAVQWHPEWRCWENDFYAAIFRAFGEACVQRQRGRPKGRALV